MISLVVPILDEREALARNLPRWQALSPAPQIIVADGGSRDGGPELAAELGADVVRTSRGRGCQLNAGARAARGEWLLFLHADCWLEDGALEEATRLVQQPQVAAVVFRQRIEGSHPAYRCIERFAGFRARWIRVPYGDSGLFVPRRAFEAVGGYPDDPLCEDLGLAMRMRRSGSVRVARSRVHLSDRRWRTRGVVRTTWRNWRIAASYLLGVSPDRLYHAYYGIAPAQRTPSPPRPDPSPD